MEVSFNKKKQILIKEYEDRLIQKDVEIEELNDMLEKLKDKFEEERNTCEKEEMEKKHAYSMMMQDLQDEIERATAEKGRKVKSKATRQEDAAGFKGDLADTTADKEADEKYLSDMVSWAENKGYEYQ